MTSNDFVYWLNGFLEVSGQKEIDANQVQIIKDHIRLVLEKRTPEYTFPDVRVNWSSQHAESC